MAATGPWSAEERRILEEYSRRERELGDFYSVTRPANLFARHSQERVLLAAATRTGLLPLSGKRILDVGCGTGDWLVRYGELGANPELLLGIELDAKRAAACAARLPKAEIRVGNAAALPWGDGEVDVVSAATVFTSILDDAMRAQVAREMLRVLRPGGAIVWYDFVYDNPKNPNVRGIGRRQLRRLFSGCDCAFWRVTLAPPLARWLVPRAWWLAELLERLKILDTHDLVIIRRRPH